MQPKEQQMRSIPDLTGEIHQSPDDYLAKMRMA